MMLTNKSRPNLNDFYNTIFRFKQWKSEVAPNWTFHGEPSPDPKYGIILKDENSPKLMEHLLYSLPQILVC